MTHLPRDMTVANLGVQVEGLLRPRRRLEEQLCSVACRYPFRRKTVLGADGWWWRWWWRWNITEISARANEDALLTREMMLPFVVAFEVAALV